MAPCREDGIGVIDVARDALEIDESNEQDEHSDDHCQAFDRAHRDSHELERRNRSLTSRIQRRKCDRNDAGTHNLPPLPPQPDIDAPVPA